MNRAFLLAATVLLATQIQAADLSGTIGRMGPEDALIYGVSLEGGQSQVYVPALPGAFCGISPFYDVTNFVWADFSDVGAVQLTALAPAVWVMSCISVDPALDFYMIYSYPAGTRDKNTVWSDEQAEETPLLQQLRWAVQPSPDPRPRSESRW